MADDNIGKVFGAKTCDGVFTPWRIENATLTMSNMTTINSPKNQNHGESSCKTNRDDIARTAFGIYEKHGSQNGNDVQNWLDAEAHVKAMHASTAHGMQPSTKAASQSVR